MVEQDPRRKALDEAQNLSDDARAATRGHYQNDDTQPIPASPEAQQAQTLPDRNSDQRRDGWTRGQKIAAGVVAGGGTLTACVVTAAVAYLLGQSTDGEPPPSLDQEAATAWLAATQTAQITSTPNSIFIQPTNTIDATVVFLQMFRDGRADVLGPPDSLIEDSVLPYGINNGAGWYTGQGARWAIRIFNGSMEPEVQSRLDPSLEIPQRFANAREFAGDYFASLGLGDMGKIDMNTLTPRQFASGGSESVTTGGVTFETSDAYYFEAQGMDEKGQVLTYQVFEVVRPDSFNKFSQIAVADPDNPKYADYQPYISNLPLRPGENLVVVRVIVGGGADGKHRMDVVLRKKCGNLAATLPLPKPKREGRAPLVATPTQFVSQPPVFQASPTNITTPEVKPTLTQTPQIKSDDPHEGNDESRNNRGDKDIPDGEGGTFPNQP